MKSNWHLDLTIPNSDPENGFSIPARLFTILHGINKGEYRFPIDILQTDTGNVHTFRIFGDQGKLTSIGENLKKHFFVRDYATVSRVRRVPTEVEYISIRRRSIPKTKGRKDTELRNKCIAYCRTLLHFNIQSKSNGKGYPFYVDFEKHESAFGDKDPSSYGLASPTRNFTVPRF